MLRFAAAVAAFFVTAAAGFGVASPAMAQSAPVQNFTVENVSAIIQEIGGTELAVSKDGSLTHVAFKLEGEPVVFTIGLCDIDKRQPGCMGLTMLFFFDLEPGHTLEAINEFNVNFGLTMAMRVDNKVLAFGRFVLAHGGITSGNVKSNYAMLAEAPGAFANMMKGKQVASVDPARPSASLSVAPAPQAARRVAPSAEQLRALMKENAKAGEALKAFAK
jgi:hypothetical protein